MSRIAYFKATPNLATESYVATQISGVTLELANKALASDLQDLQDVVNAKADASAIDGLASVTYVDGEIATVNTALGGKASASALSTLETAVAGKASSASVTALSDELAGKASASDLASGLAGKVDQSVYDARLANETAFFVAFADGVYLESAPASGVEFDYVANGLVPAPEE